MLSVAHSELVVRIAFGILLALPYLLLLLKGMIRHISAGEISQSKGRSPPIHSFHASDMRRRQHHRLLPFSSLLRFPSPGAIAVGS